MSAEEIGIIILLALVVIGPQRLPEYAEQLGKLVRNVRQMATGATQTIREELGDDIADIDLSKFDPRQYDPRRIVREALLEDIVPATKPARPKAPARPAKPVSAGGPSTTAAATKPKPKPAPKATPATPATEDAAPSSTDTDASTETEASSVPAAVATAAVTVPFDDEAT